MIDATRHNSVFDPGAFGKRRVDVIGVGATGSKLALTLAKLGVMNLHVWDFDTVEPHNLANQAYSQRHLGMNKAQAIAEIAQEATGWPVTAYHRPYEGGQLGEFVFAMPDTMSARRLLFDALRFSMTTQRVFDPRMGAGEGQIYSYRPTLPADRERYERTLFSDDDAHVQVSACGTAITVGPTGDVLVGLLAWQFINLVNDPQAELPWLAVSGRDALIERLG